MAGDYARVIGFLEDDPDQAALVEHWLEEAGYDVRLFSNADAFRAGRGAEVVDLLLLDLILPDADGLEILSGIRASANAGLPIIVLTARSEEADIVRGLEGGADDYVSKPPRRAELLARITATFRRSGEEDDASVTVTPYRFDLTRRRVSIDGEDVELTQREFDLALYLFRRDGRIISREALLENVWHLSPMVSTRTVDTHISRLRKKLLLAGEKGWRLTAVYQHGYRLEKV